MPAQRLPWIKFWPEAIEHEKFAALTDAESWTWVVVWSKASLQPKRWRFASVAHAAHVTGRPVKHIRRLLEVRLLDECDEGLMIHDAPMWQDASNLTPTHREPPPNGDATVTEAPGKGDAMVTLAPPNGGLEGEVEGDIDRDDVTPSLRSGGSAPSLAAAANGKVHSKPVGNARVARVIDAFRELGPEPMMNDRDRAAIKRSNAPPGLIAECYDAVLHGEWGDDFQRKRLTVHEAVDWVNAYSTWRDQEDGEPVPKVPEHVCTSRCAHVGAMKGVTA